MKRSELQYAAHLPDLEAFRLKSAEKSELKINYCATVRLANMRSLQQVVIPCYWYNVNTRDRKVERATYMTIEDSFA